MIISCFHLHSTVNILNYQIKLSHKVFRFLHCITQNSAASSFWQRECKSSIKRDQTTIIHIAIPKTPKDHTPLVRPAATIIGLRTPARTNACLAMAMAEFLKHVGNNSIVYIISMLKEEQTLKYATSSRIS